MTYSNAKFWCIILLRFSFHDDDSLLRCCSAYFVHCFVFAGVVGDWKASVPSKNHASWLLQRMVILHIWTTRQGAGRPVPKESDRRNVENQIKIEPMISCVTTRLLRFSQTSMCIVSSFFYILHSFSPFYFSWLETQLW